MRKGLLEALSLLSLATTALAFADVAAASTITYSVDFACTSCGSYPFVPAAPASLTGTITTDGAIGSLSTADISAYSLTADVYNTSDVLL